MSFAATLSRPFRIAARPARAARYRVRVFANWDDAAARWQGEVAAGAAGTAFQMHDWLEAFYAAAKCDAQVTPLIAVMEEAVSGEFALALPLVLRRHDSQRVIEFADLGMTDFNAPLLGPAAPSAGEAAEALAALRRALPPADLLCLKKMPPVVDGRANPLAHLAGAHASAVNGNLVTMGEDHDAWRHSLPRTVRKELERSWRVFTRREGTGFRSIDDADEALRILEVMDGQQRARLEELGQPYQLGDAVTMAMHRELMQRVGGFVSLTVLEAGEEIVAALLGVRRGDTIVFIRLTHGGAEWTNCSPGRLILSRTLGHLHAQGVRKFDFSVGNFAYKRRFGVVRQPLVDFAMALSWRGWMPLLRLLAGATMRRHPELRRRVRRLLGKRDLREEN